jgi:hypothetical protein
VTYVILGLLVLAVIAGFVAYIAIMRAKALGEENKRLASEIHDLGEEVSRIQAADKAQLDRTKAISSGTVDERAKASVDVLADIAKGKK